MIDDIVDRAEKHLRAYMRGDYCDHHDECIAFRDELRRRDEEESA